jgi:hypothetical protein
MRATSRACWSPARFLYRRETATTVFPTDTRRWASVPLRLIVGYGFMAHGVAKLSHGSDAFAGILQQLAVPLPHVTAWLTIASTCPANSARYHFSACRHQELSLLRSATK